MAAAGLPARRDREFETAHGGLHGAEPPGQYLPCVSEPMRALAAIVARVAASDVPVLICGETGSGKSTLARQIFQDSPRHGAALVVLHAATATVEAVEALAQRADRTVLIEEVGELSPSAQDRLMHVLGSGSAGTLRFITTSSRDPAEISARGALRTDLFYRLDVVRLEIPPLRRRPADIVFLAQYLLALAARHLGRDRCALQPDAQERLLQHPWPGNVHELNNCIMESVLHCPDARLGAADLRLRVPPAGGEPEGALTGALSRLHAAHPNALYARVERVLLEWALEACAGNRLRAAALLDIGRGSLRAKLRRHGLKESPRPPANRRALRT
jgi:DNA-binding NtrC family response regulator